MRKVKLYIAISLDGKIAKPDGSVGWLESIPNPDHLDYGYLDFYNSIDTTIQGYTTYRQVIDLGVEFPYADKKNYVFTRKQDLKPTNYVSFVTKDHVEFVQNLKASPGKDIWLVGGGQLNALFLSADLIDEIQLFVMPVILTEGIDLFGALPIEKRMRMEKSESFNNGVVRLVYANAPAHAPA